VYTALVDRVAPFDVLDDLPQVLDLAGAGADLASEPPTPAIAVAQTAVTRDIRVSDEEVVAVG
jgi:hypothetical protein